MLIANVVDFSYLATTGSHSSTYPSTAEEVGTPEPAVPLHHSACGKVTPSATCCTDHSQVEEEVNEIGLVLASSGYNNHDGMVAGGVCADLSVQN